VKAITSALTIANADMPSIVALEPNCWITKAPKRAPATPPKLNAALALVPTTGGKPAPVNIAGISRNPM
jgi:hypothetical protein